MLQYITYLIFCVQVQAGIHQIQIKGWELYISELSSVSPSNNNWIDQTTNGPIQQLSCAASPLQFIGKGENNLKRDIIMPASTKYTRILMVFDFFLHYEWNKSTDYVRFYINNVLEHDFSLSQTPISDAFNSHYYCYSYLGQHYDTKYHMEYEFEYTSSLIELFFEVKRQPFSYYGLANFLVYRYTSDIKHCSLSDLSGKCNSCDTEFQKTQSGNCECYLDKYYNPELQCVRFCPSGYSPDSYNRCQPSIYTALFTDLTLPTFTSYGFKYIQDPQHPYTYTNNKILIINSKSVGGEFKYNDVIEYSPLNILAPKTISIKFSLYFQGIYSPYYIQKKAYQYSRVNLIVNNYLIQRIQIFNEDEIFSQMNKVSNASCGDQCIQTQWEYIYKINEPITSLKFAGHFSIHHPQINWSIRDLTISEVGQTITPTPCNSPCSTCKSTDQSYCYSCIGTYVLYYGECINNCPSFATLSSGICTDPDITPNSQYITNLYGNQRYILTQDFPTIKSDFETFLYGAQYTVLGGFNIWYPNEIISYSRTNLNQFYKIDIYFTIMYIDITDFTNQYVQFTYGLNPSISLQLTTESPIGNVQGDNLPEYEYQFHYTNTFPSINNIQFNLQCYQDSTLTTTYYCAMYNFRVIIQKCSTYCSDCDIFGSCGTIKISSNASGTGCGDGYFFDNELGECSKCDNTCKTCFQSPNNCLTCDANHILLNGECFCPNFLSRHPTCNSQECDKGCLACESSSECLVCDITKHKWLNIDKCECQDGYYQEYDQSCQLCYPSCKTCVTNPRLCLSCDSSLKRHLSFQQCECDDGYFQDNNSLICTLCDVKCQTCKYTSDSCTSCSTLQHRTLNSNQCICADGYFESGVNVCDQCSNLCETCSDKDVCLSCKKSQGRQMSIHGKVCVCQSGYFQMEGQPSCDICNYTCLECTANGADSCYRCPDSREQSSIESPFYCKCKRGYYEVGQSKQCNDCANYINPPSTHYCYSKCGDGIVQWNEDCDDINTDTRDGCINCLFPASHCLDEPCTSCRASQCVGCKDGYYLGLDSICHRCSEICKTCKTKADNCLSCMLTASDGTCVKCTAEQGLQILNGQCVNICGDGLKVDGEQCDDGNTDDGDGCDSKCQVEKGYICQEQCEIINYVEILLSTDELDTIYNPIRHILLETDQPIQITGSIVDQIEVKFTNYTDFSVDYKDQTEYNDTYYMVKVAITLTLNQMIISPIAIVSFTYPDNINNIQGYSMLNNSNITKLKDYLIPSENVKAATANLMDFSQYILYIMLGLAGIAFLFGGLHIFWNLLDLLQLLSYIKYFNVQYPYNVEVYFALFGFAEFDFLKDQINLEDIISQYIDTPDAAAKFQEEGYSTVFYVNAIAVVTVFATTLGTYLLCSLVSLIVKFIAKSIVTSKIEDDDEAGVFFFFVMKITKNMENYLFHITAEFKSGILRTFMAVAFDMNLAIFLQLFDFNTENIFLLSSGILSIIVYIIEIYFIYFGFLIMAKPKYYLDLKATENSYGALYEGLLINNKSFIRGFNLLNLLKKMIFMFFLVFLYNVPSFQILFISVLNLTFAAYIIYVKPFEEPSEYHKTYISELIIWIIELIVLLFAYNEQTLNFNIESQLIIGWFVIGLCTLLILIQLAIDVKQHADFLMKEYSILRKLVDRLRGLLKDDESGKEEDNIFLNKHMRMHVPGSRSKSTLKSKKVVTFTLSSSSDS